MSLRSRKTAGDLIAQHNRLLRLAARGFSPLRGFWVLPEACRRHLRAAGVSRVLRRNELHQKRDFDRLIARNLAAILSKPLEQGLVDALRKFSRPSASCAVTIIAARASSTVELLPSADVADRIRLGWASPWRALLGTLPENESGFAVTDVAILIQAIPPNVTASGTIRTGLNQDRPDVLVSLGSIADGTLKRLRTAFGPVARDLEVEWLLAGRLFVVNARRVDSRTFTGIPISPGTARGVARVVRTAADAASLQTADVIVSPYLIPELTPSVPRVAGVVIEAAGSTSHVAIVARQFGVPAVFGVRGIARSIGDGAVATVDGSQGRVIIERR